MTPASTDPRDARITELEAEVADLKARLATADAKTAALNGEVASQRQELSSCTQHARKLNLEHQSALNQIENQEKEIGILQAANRELAQENAILHAEWSAAVAEITRLTATSATLRKENADLRFVNLIAGLGIATGAVVLGSRSRR